MRREQISRADARRVALAAQGFGRARPERAPTVRDLQGLITRLGQFQIDSINVVTRAHFMPAFSRLGPYDADLVMRAAHRAPRRLFEYWGHAASLIDVELQPSLRFRMNAGAHIWGGIERVARENPQLVEFVRGEIADRGPMSARDLERDLDRAGARDRSNWGWNWSSVKTVLEWLFYVGEVTSAYRNSQFERVYDLPDRVLPPAVIERATPSPEEAARELVRRAAAALGVASEYCLRDYFRTRPEPTRVAIADLVEAGELLPIRIEGWDRPAYLWHAARHPRAVHAKALLSPFDSLIFERTRLEKLFGFNYRIEIYVPEPKRIYGYYVYPFLLGDRFVARVDLKADRKADVLRVNSAWLEEGLGIGAGEVAAELVVELGEMARWLGLGRVQVLPRGDLAPALDAVNLDNGRRRPIWPTMDGVLVDNRQRG